MQCLQGLRLLDDDFMQKVFEDKACTEFLLQIILNRTDLKVLRVNGQQDIKNLQGRSVRLDILAVDANNRVYNIEIQRSDKGDESHIIYVNSQIKDESALGKLMHDFSCIDAKDMRYKILADRVRYFKEDEKGVATVCKAMEEIRKEELIEVAERLLKLKKLSYEEIAEIAKLTVEEVKALDENYS